MLFLHRQERNLLDAASNGALPSLKIVGAIAANLIAFMSMLAFINATLAWFGDRAGVENLTFELYIIGTPGRPQPYVCLHTCIEPVIYIQICL